MKIFFQYFVLFSLFLAGLAVPCYGQTATLKGKILTSGEALPFATISLGDKFLFSDRQGEYQFTVQPGNYIFKITYTGYKKVEREINLDAGNTQTIDVIMVPVEQMGEVVVIGTRFAVQRSNLVTPVPIDVISSDQLTQTGQPSVMQMLTYTAPSFNASRQTANEPITLRGLDPDHVLILVNGTRYHNQAYINDGRIRGILGRGSVANNLSSIPFSAIEKIEILRDGASAQYGSDAIAGVLNIILKKNVAKTSVQLHAGQHYKNDGEAINLGITHGINLGKKLPSGRQGFLTLSGEFQFREPTYRGGAYLGTVYTNNKTVDDSICDTRNFNRTNVSNARNSRLRNIGLAINGGHPVGKKTEFFWTAAVSGRRTTFISAYRYPKNSKGVNTELFPDGFQASTTPKSTDASGIAGAKGELKNSWHWEYSSSYGNNTAHYHVKETNNASQQFLLGKNAPSSFYTGTIIYQQLTNNIHWSKDLSKKFRGFYSFNLGFGAEWRVENFRIKKGEEASWKNYDSTGRKQGGSQNSLVFRPEDEADESRNVGAVYVDLESELSEKLLIALAGRYEYYNDFGGNIAGKLAARYKISPQFSLRGSASNGFRAPSLQQRYYAVTSKNFSLVNGVLAPVTRGIFTNDSEVATLFGVPSLHAEKSVNLGAGFTAAFFNRISLTADVYWIKIKDRIVLSGIFDRRLNPDVDSLLANYPDIDRVQFFANAINTKTIGFDLAINGNWKIKKADLLVTLGANFTQTRLFGAIRTVENLEADSANTNTLFSVEEKDNTEDGQPSDKIILFIRYKTGKFGFNIRNTRFGTTSTTNTILTNPSRTLYEFFSPRMLTDISAEYSFQHWATFTVGANNIFNVYPDKIQHYQNTAEGTFIYSQDATPFGYNGGYYFINMAFNF